MKQLLKLYLSYLTVHLPNARIKNTCFRMLWFNYEMKIETGNEKNTKQNTPPIHDFG